MKLIWAELLEEKLYHEAFETDTDLQKWDSGCWIRYKMVEKAITEAPKVDAATIVRCKNCVYYMKSTTDRNVCLRHSSRVWENDYCSYGTHI